MFKRMRRRLTILYTSVMAGVFLVLLIGAHGSMEWAIWAESERDMQLFAEEEAAEYAQLFRREENFRAAQEFGAERTGRLYFYAFGADRALLTAVCPVRELESTILSQIAQWEPDADETKLIVYEAADGTVYRLLMAASPIIVDDGAAGMVYVGRDVTSLCRGLHQAALFMGIFAAGALLLAGIAGYVLAGRAILPLKSAYERQRQFAADASHELRTPLSVIMSSVDVLENEAALATPFLRQIMADMKDEIRKMAKLVGDLLMVARNDDPAAEAVWETFDLTRAAESVIRRLQPLAEAKGIRLLCTAQRAVQLRAEIIGIQRLLFIFVDNAIKYTPEGGVVTVCIERPRDADAARIAVKDTGIGIAPEEQKKIFARFYRVDKARSRVSGGTGLGLAIAAGIVAAHRGTLTVQSTPGEGSVFTAVIPGSGQ